MGKRAPVQGWPFALVHACAANTHQGTFKSLTCLAHNLHPAWYNSVESCLKQKPLHVSPERPRSCAMALPCKETGLIFLRTQYNF